MPTVTYTFVLPDDDEELKYFQDGPHYRQALGDVWQKVRCVTKHQSEEKSEDEMKAYYEIRDCIVDICGSYDIEVP